jgi:2-oxoglutarate dehydrogenase E2 component (dihydrolipoamide succinyltransferase)
MAVEVVVPQSGESIREVQIGVWRKAEGDRVDRDEILVELETDKAAMDLPAPVGGILKKILKKDGAEAAVGDVIALIEERAPDQDEAMKASSPPKKPARHDAAPPAQGNAAPPPHAEAAPPPAASPAKARPQLVAERPAPAAGGQASEPRVMPAARRALQQRGLREQDVKGTGPGGRILKEDVAATVRRDAEGSGREAIEAQPAAAPEPGEDAEGGGGREEQVVPMSPMRRVIAKNLVAAQQNAALLTTFNEADMTSVIELRKRHQEAFQAKHGIKLGFMSFFVKAAIEALKLVPQVNAEIRDKSIVYKNYYDIGVAVGGGRGLVVPVLRNAERMSFADVEKGIADFARRAKDNQIELSELQGGTFTISNGGIYGSMLSTPIVNAPQSGILGLHAIQDRPVAVAGQVVVRPMMYLALTYDHRLVDGREAVTFLKHIKDQIEDPVRILVEI